MLFSFFSTNGHKYVITMECLLFRIRASKYDLMNGIIPFFLFNVTVFFYFHSYNSIKTAKKNKKKLIT